jgi:competence protein ComEC
LVVTARETPPGCAATAIDRKALRASGALELRWVAGQWQIAAARPAGQDRPWARSMPQRAPMPTTPRPAPRDATPRVEDLEPGD